MCFSKDICPVPFDQQPLNEFYALKESCFFSFFGFKLRQYVYSITIIVFILILLFAPIFLKVFKVSWSNFLINEFFCIIFTLSLILIRLYLGWSYIIDRLFSATVFYEESGWYDGQIWIKTPEMLTKDRLIGTYYIVPILQRIRLTFTILILLLATKISLFYLLC